MSLTRHKSRLVYVHATEKFLVEKHFAQPGNQTQDSMEKNGQETQWTLFIIELLTDHYHWIQNN